MDLVPIFTVTLTLGLYALTRRAFLRYGHALLSPVFMSTALTITTLTLMRLPFERYRPGQRVMTFLLGPAVVALAIPLFRQRHIVRERLCALSASVMGGTAAGLLTAIAMARALGMEPVVVASLAPRSITAPVAVEIARFVGGDPTLTATFVIATGTLGSMLGPRLLTLLGIDDPVARGVAVGTTAHGQGTAMMFLEGETQGALAGVALALTAVIGAVAAPTVIPRLIALGN